ncbi:MAG: hypothetical protein NVS3B10_28830 [Polyangiales bacterium]
MRRSSFGVRALRALAFALVWACPIVTLAQPLKTWGEGQTQPELPTEHDVGHEPAPPPPPPPEERHPPQSGERRAPSDERAAEPSPGIVRGPGRVGLRYILEGVEVRGNTSTLGRVIQRFVPFRPGDSLDVDDKELLLTRFRLLGTGFVRDVPLSLRRGS